MKLTVEIEHIKNLRTLKEWVIQNGSPDEVNISGSLFMRLLQSPEELKRYVDKYTKEEIRFAKKLIGKKFVAMLKYNSIENFQLYMDLYEQAINSFKDVCELLSTKAKQGHPLATKIEQRTKSIVVVSNWWSSSSFTYNIAVAEVPRLLWDRYINLHSYSDAHLNIHNNIPEKYYIKQVEVKSKIENDGDRRYMIVEILYEMIKKTPSKLDHIERITSYLANLPTHKLAQIYYDYHVDTHPSFGWSLNL
jgi:hypothetical protein